MNTTSQPELFILAGEQSGDLHGGHILQSLRQIHPEWKIIGVPGPKMRLHGIEQILPMEELQVMGFAQILCSLPKLRRQYLLIRNTILEQQPKIVLLIDYPGFNLRLAKGLRKAGYKGKIIQFVSPTVWAWGKGRIQTLAENIDLLLTLFPFEASYFKDTPLKVTYVGHPLVTAIREYHYQEDWRNAVHLPRQQELIGIFPGSRPSELHQILPKQIATVQKLLASNPQLQAAVSCSQDEYHSHIKQMLPAKGFTIVPKEYTYELMRDCRTAIATSGTVTLELACHARPSIVVYIVSGFNRFVAKYLLRLKLPHFCIVNICANETVYPELIEKPFTAESAFPLLKEMNENEELREKCKTQCREIADELYRPDSLELIVNSITDLLNDTSL